MDNLTHLATNQLAIDTFESIRQLPRGGLGVFLLSGLLISLFNDKTKNKSSINEKFIKFPKGSKGKPELIGYVRIVVWFFQLQGYAKQFIILCNRIIYLQKHSGSKFLVAYLKEATRIYIQVLSGNVTSPNRKGVLVAVSPKSGLPMIIPTPLRNLKSRVLIRGVLTVLTCYRKVAYVTPIDYSSITEKFNGISQLGHLPEMEVVHKWFAPYNNGLTKLILPNAELRFLTTSGPNHKLSWVSAYIDGYL